MLSLRGRLLGLNTVLFAVVDATNRLQGSLWGGVRLLLRAATQQRPTILFELGSMCHVCSMLLTRTYSGELKC